jgi:nucleoid-associated protein YgaU
LVDNLNLTIDLSAKKINFSGFVFTAAHKKRVSEIIKSFLKSDELFDIQKIVVTNTYIALPGDTYDEIARKVYGDSRLGDDLYKSQYQAFRSPEVFRTLSFSVVYLPDLNPRPYVVR